MTKSAALALSFDLCDRLMHSTIQLLGLLQLPHLVERLLNVDPEKERDLHKINIIYKKINFNICCHKTLEFARRRFCDVDCIATFLIRHEELFRRDRRLTGARMKLN
jgi:hypothetical protein